MLELARGLLPGLELRCLRQQPELEPELQPESEPECSGKLRELDSLHRPQLAELGVC